MIDSERLAPRDEPADAAAALPGAGTTGAPADAPLPGGRRQEQVFAAEVRLLYDNAATGALAGMLIAIALAYGIRTITSLRAVSLWLLYMVVVAVARYTIARRYHRASPADAGARRWLRAFIAGTAMAAAGWGAAGLLFYQSAQPMGAMFLVFVIGGVMLGGVSLLAARPEAFLAFLLPAGMLTAGRVAAEGGEQNAILGFLAALFTAVTVATAWRLHRAIASSLQLGFDNHELLESLQAAKRHTDALNRELEMRVRDRTARLIEADQRKDEFLATLAHELRNPLAPIRFALEHLKPGASPELAARARGVIERQVSQLVRLVDDLLDVARITSDKLVLRREPHDLGRLMAIAVESIEPLAAAAGHQVTAEPPADPVFVDVDATRIVQVFANVLSNAVKFTPPGGRIWFTAERTAGEDVVVRVRDTGIGIALEALPRVFDLFRQAQPLLERSAGGLGIELTLARRLVDMHGGRIAVHSPGPGRGTEVEIVLPVTAAPDLATGPAHEPAAPSEARPLRVLIVEDNPDAAAMLEMMVSQHGHTARVVHDGAAAITAAAEFAPDLVLLDIGLPIISGYAVASALRAREELSRVHIAAITGWGQEEDRRKAREAGCDSHFTKPLAPEALADLLASVARQANGAHPGVIETARTRRADGGLRS